MIINSLLSLIVLFAILINFPSEMVFAACGSAIASRITTMGALCPCYDATWCSYDGSKNLTYVYEKLCGCTCWPDGSVCGYETLRTTYIGSCCSSGGDSGPRPCEVANNGWGAYWLHIRVVDLNESLGCTQAQLEDAFETGAGVEAATVRLWKNNPVSELVLTPNVTDEDGEYIKYLNIGPREYYTKNMRVLTSKEIRGVTYSQYCPLTVGDPYGAWLFSPRPSKCEHVLEYVAIDMPPDCGGTYNLNVDVKDASGGCGSLGSSIDNALVTISADTPGEDPGTVEIFSGLTGSSVLGRVTLNNLSTDYSTLYFQSSKVVGDDLYVLQCPTPYHREIFDPVAVECTDQTIELGIAPVEAVSWKTVIDGDIYAQNVGIEVPESALLGGFSNYLINTSGGSGGFALVEGFISAGPLKIYEEGGYSENLLDAGFSHSDIALSKLSFIPPDHAELVTDFSSFSSGIDVYQMSVEDFNSSLSAPVFYTTPGEIAVLYITGSDIAIFDADLIKVPGSGSLVLVFQSNVLITSNVGVTPLLFSINSTPNIGAAIIAAGSIEIESLGTNPGTDVPIMLTGPFISETTLSLNRDLGVSNSSLPAIAVKHDQTLMCKIGKLEKDNADYSNYTGLRTFDIQFDYQE